jgi:hypothetical protein
MNVTTMAFKELGKSMKLVLWYGNILRAAELAHVNSLG